MPSKGKHESARNLRVFFEVGDSTAKVLVAKRQSGSWQVVKADQLSMPIQPQPGQGEPMATLRPWLHDLVRATPQIRTAESFLLISGLEATMMEFEKTGMGAKPTQDDVLWQMTDHLPFAAEEAIVKWESRNGSICAAAVKQTYLNEILKNFHAESIYPEYITLLPLAYEALIRNGFLATAQNAVILNIGKCCTSFIAIRNGSFHFMRSIPLGSESITLAMMGVFVIEGSEVLIQYEEAKTLKKTYGLPTPHLLPNPSQPKLSQLSERVRPVLEKMVHETKASLVHLQEKAEFEKIEKVWLTGEGAALKGLNDYLSEQLNVEIHLLHAQQIDERLDLSMAGLAGVLFMNERRLNFAPSEDSLKPKFQFYRKILQALTAILLVAFFGISAFYHILIKQLHAQDKELEKKWAQMGPRAEEVGKIDALVKEVAMRRELFRKSARKQVHLGAVLRELSHLTPESITLKQIRYSYSAEGPKATIEGVVQFAVISPDLELTLFLERLQSSPFFDETSLESRSVKDKSPGSLLAFTLQTTPVFAAHEP